MDSLRILTNPYYSAKYILTNLYNRGKYILNRDGIKVFFSKGFNYVSIIMWIYIQRICTIDKILYNMSLSKLLRYMKEERGLDDIINTAYNFRGFGIYKLIMPVQFKEEISLFAKMIHKCSPEVLVEIGTGYGGTLYIFSRYLNSIQKIICVDLDDRFFNLGYFKQRNKFLREFAPNKEIYCVFGNSHDDLIELELSKMLNGKKIDILFIDGDHSYTGLRDDFERYEKYVAQGGIIALHDIASLDYNSGPPKYWKEIKKYGYRTEEIIFRGGRILWGIGVVFIDRIAVGKKEANKKI